MVDQNITNCNLEAIFNELDVKTEIDIKHEQHEVEGEGLYTIYLENDLVNRIRMSKTAIEVLFHDIDTTNVNSISRSCKNFLLAARNILKTASQYETSFDIQANYNIEHFDHVGSLGFYRWLISAHLKLKDILEKAIADRLANAGTLIGRFTAIEKSLEEVRTHCRFRYPNAHSMVIPTC